jgi:LacI family transcriptional regulator
MRAAADAGLLVPEDISIVGFDDDYLSRYLNPPLTTMALPASGMGSAAVSMLLRRVMGEEEGEASRVVLPCQIAVRGSVKRLEPVSQ